MARLVSIEQFQLSKWPMDGGGPHRQHFAIPQTRSGCIAQRELARLLGRTLPFVAERLFEKCAAKAPICSGVATDVTGRIRFVKSVCPTSYSST
jgi:hypothetical protein